MLGKGTVKFVFKKCTTYGKCPWICSLNLCDDCVEVFFTVGYQYEIDRVREVLLEMAKKGKKVLEDPSPWVLVNKCSENGVEYAVRAWGKAEDWTNVRFYLLENGKRALDEADIRIPYPQMDVHIKQD